MTPVVVDSSALVEFLLATSLGETVSRRLIGVGVERHLPDLCPIEIASALRGLVVGGKLSATRGEKALSDLHAFIAERHRAEPLLPRVWELRSNLTVYDASYVALAEVLDAPLITTDAKFDTPAVTRLVDVQVIGH